MTATGDAGHMVPHNEVDILLAVFREMLKAASGDGNRKRRAGTKPPWWRDPSHEPAVFSHLAKWKRGERIDSDSGAHPLVHLAWRALAIAYQDTWGQVDPEVRFVVDAQGGVRDLRR